ncbi:hypothetical protein DOJK_01057 [Patescibacteria group bacterium]|mgnify:CR=1 FL=1|nr:hypothetical protein DOJK_01057 [Patescibacteria group bacterium]
MDNPEYFKTDQMLIADFSDTHISELYAKGYVLTRLEKGIFNQTRSLRIDLSKFELNSENKRILKKNEDLIIKYHILPYKNYTWEIHKLGKEFYSVKFGDGTMSAAKIKEMFTDTNKSNLNGAFKYLLDNAIAGYALVYANEDILHYAYPFYDLNLPKDLNVGMGMMLKAILWAKENNRKYIYLGSVTDQKAKYKLQFEGLEWFNTNDERWLNDLDQLKALLK